MSSIPHEEKIREDYEGYHSFMNSKKEVVLACIENSRKDRRTWLCSKFKDETSIFIFTKC